MSNYHNYYPILKWKKGEKIAIEHFDGNKQIFIPVIELIDECTPNEFFEDLKLYHNGPIYFDTIKIDDESRSILKQFTQFVIDNHIAAFPILYVDDVYGLNDIDEFEQLKHYGIKLSIPEDFEGPSNEEILSFIISNKKNKIIDLFLDADVIINKKEANSAFASYKEIIYRNQKQLSKFNQIIICLTSFPESLSEVGSGEDAIFNRYDIKIFIKLLSILKETKIYQKVSYADYGVTKFTDTELDFRLMKNGVLPKVKYTTYDKYIVCKGKRNTITKVYTRSYNDIANQIIHSDFYFGKDFSYGDNAIYEKATDPDSKPGNSTNWVTYVANHHIAVVLEQLSKLFDV